jgi:hypothetical protein
VKSERCTWEVERTIELSKRLLPVIFKPVPERDVPEKLRRLQFVRFDSGPGFARPLSQLADALRVDLDWFASTRDSENWRAAGRGGRARNRCFCGGMILARRRLGWPPARWGHPRSPTRSAL